MSLSLPPAKKKHVPSKFQSDWGRFQMTPSKKGPTFSFCTVCNVDFSISGGGVHEVKRHCDSAKHKNALVGVSAQPKISSVMATVSVSEKVLRSELSFCCRT